MPIKPSKTIKKMKGGLGEGLISGAKNTVNGMYQTIMNFFKRLTNKDEKDAEWRTCIIRYIVITVIVIGVCVMSISIMNNQDTASHNVDKYYFVIVIPLLLIFAILFNIGKQSDGSESGLSAFLKISGVLLFLGAIVYFYSQMHGGGSINIPSLYQNYALVALISVVGLAIAYHVLSEYIARLPGWMGFIGQLLFFIPCMLYDAWMYMFQQFKITPASIYVLIFVEFLLILVYIFLPKINNTITGLDDGKQLLVNPVILNKGVQVIATSDDLKVPQTLAQLNNNINPDQYRTNYCISMWVFVNPQNGSNAAYTTESEIFKYGYYTDASGGYDASGAYDPSGTYRIEHVKPMIRYYGGAGNGTDTVNERDKFVFYFSEYVDPPTGQYVMHRDTFYDVSVPTQKWNQFVFNYNRNNVDLFINGRLERSFVMTGTMPQYNHLDQITIGNNNGVQGAICNVAYYNHPLSQQQITYAYNMLIGKNPPIGLGTNIDTQLSIPTTTSSP
jgi:hypothetical protein